MVGIAQSLASTTGHLRPFDVTRDLNAVADLVELCFADTLDPDGERYLRQMRDAARSISFLGWAKSVANQSSLPMSGLVWEEDGKVVGNLSLIPFSIQQKRCFLIANVAVHPDYRRRGIARTLTSTAQEQAQQRNTTGTWLQVREDNEPAVELYLSLGFKEHARRTTWQANRDTLTADPQNIFAADQSEVHVIKQASSYWSQQSLWLMNLYPVELAWHLPINIQALSPGFIGALRRFINGMEVESWAVLRSGRLLGAVTWQAFQGYSDYLWLSVPPEIDDPAIYSLLKYARQHVSDRRTLSLDFPAYLASQAIQAAGFQPRQTLIWMVSPA